MAAGRFFSRPEYREYVRLLSRLHVLIASDDDEGPGAERLRSQLDECSEAFHDDEIASLQGIAGDLYSLTDEALPSANGANQPEPEMVAAVQALCAGDLVGALALVRKARESIGPLRLAYFRGRILFEAGLPDVALPFFELAAALDPTNGAYQVIALDALKRTDLARARKRALELVSGENRPASLLLKAAEIRLDWVRELPAPEAEAVRGQLIPVLYGVIVDLESNGAGSPSSPLPMAYALVASCHQELGNIGDALRCFDLAIRLDHNNAALLTARGIMRYGYDTASAVADFQSAVAADASIVWPYLFLAHYYLSQERYDAGLAMCESSSQFRSSNRVRANVLEWMAICRAMLGFDPETVRQTFQEAMQLAPDNGRIKRNSATFERSLANPTFERVLWEQHDGNEVRTLARSEFRLAA